MVYRHFLVSGLVQGVSFRAFAQRMGMNLGLNGQVRNLRDGRVEIVAVGKPDELEKFLNLIKAGPRKSRVDTLAVKDVAGEAHLDGFSILEDGERPWFE